MQEVGRRAARGGAATLLQTGGEAGRSASGRRKAKQGGALAGGGRREARRGGATAGRWKGLREWGMRFSPIPTTPELWDLVG